MPMLQPGNIDLNNRPVVQNQDGTISTVRSMSVNIDGHEILIPTVSDDGRIMGDKEAIRNFKKTGKHLGIFSDPGSATEYAEKLHDQQGQMYGNQQPMPDLAAAQEGMRRAFKTPEPKPQEQGPGLMDQVSSFLNRQFVTPKPEIAKPVSEPELDKGFLQGVSNAFKGNAQKDALSKLRR